MLDNPEGYREFCLSLGDVTEKMPFGKFAERYASVLALYVEGHMFTYADTADYGLLNIKVSPLVVDELHARWAAVGLPMNLSKRHWVSVDVRSDMPEAEIETLLRNAYDIVRRQYTKKRRPAIAR